MLAEWQWAEIFGAAKKRGARWPDGADVAAFKREVEAALVASELTTSTFDDREKPVGPQQSRKVTPKGIALIHSFEQCKLDAYPDPGSKDGHPWTIGWGSTGPDIKKGTRWTQEQCDARFEADLAKFSEGVDRLLGGVSTTPHQFDALCSLAYNIGLNALRNSTLLRLHKAGDYKGAARQFLRWNKNDGKVMRGLTRRRLAESDLYDD